jgi:hypothetical protein
VSGFGSVRQQEEKMAMATYVPLPYAGQPTCRHPDRSCYPAADPPTN